MANETIELEAVHFPVTNLQEAEDSAGGFVSIDGEAVTLADGAAVRTGPVDAGGLEVAVPDASPWPDDVAGRRVTVRGRLIKGAGGWSLETITYELHEA